MMSRRGSCFVLLALAMMPAGLSAQNSVFGVRGIGFPVRPHSVRARALGGAYAMFDRTSVLNPAAVAGYFGLEVSATYSSLFRDYSIDGMSVTGIRETRFPLGIIGGSVGRSAFTFAMSFASYAERSYDIQTSGIDTVRGVEIEVEDRIQADGGITDIRGALGLRVNSRLNLGAGFHLITGSTRVDAKRDFLDSEFRTFETDTDVNFSGEGVSLGVQWLMFDNVQLAAAGRYSTEMTSTIDNQSSQSVDLPLSVSGGMMIEVTPSVRWSSAGQWQSWGDAAGGVDAVTVGIFDTWDVGSGLELNVLGANRPLRLGVRYATLPFSPTEEQPHEWGFSGGIGAGFAGGRGRMDIVLERLRRDGAGVSERAWHLMFGLSVQP